jgi:hypothetical protein
MNLMKGAISRLFFKKANAPFYSALPLDTESLFFAGFESKSISIKKSLKLGAFHKSSEGRGAAIVFFGGILYYS